MLHKRRMDALVHAIQKLLTHISLGYGHIQRFIHSDCGPMHDGNLEQCQIRSGNIRSGTDVIYDIAETMPTTIVA